MQQAGAVKRNKYWVCPYFGWDGPCEVACEAGRPRFPTRSYANRYMIRYCAGNWKQCSLAAALNEYYEEVDQDDRKTQGNKG